MKRIIFSMELTGLGDNEEEARQSMIKDKLCRDCKEDQS